MSVITGLTKGKLEWTPEFIKSLDRELCIGCGRCFKVCAHDVLSYCEEFDEDDAASAKAYMMVANDGNCIGCQACGRTCSKKCFSFEAVMA